MTNAGAEWGSQWYDRTPGNQLLSPDALLACLYEVRDAPGEIARRAYISLELARQPELDEDTRHAFLTQATEEYELLIRCPETVIDRGQTTGQVRQPEDIIAAKFTHAFLPLYDITSVTERKKANKEVQQRAREYTAWLETLSLEPLKRSVAVGAAAQLLATVALRQKGLFAVPSLFRQDNSIPTVHRKRYSWDVTASQSAEDEDYMLFQVKHGNFEIRKAAYHDDITVHRIFPVNQPPKQVVPAIFGLLKRALMMDGAFDAQGYHAYMKRLESDLATAKVISLKNG